METSLEIPTCKTEKKMGNNIKVVMRNVGGLNWLRVMFSGVVL
jgi:hypothetical protein